VPLRLGKRQRQYRKAESGFFSVWVVNLSMPSVGKVRSQLRDGLLKRSLSAIPMRLCCLSLAQLQGLLWAVLY
jgi:hypothetical protein